MSKKIQKNIVRLIIVFCIAGLSYNYYGKIKKILEKNALKSSSTKRIISGRITSISEVNKSNGKWIRYSFYFNGKENYSKVRDNFSYKCSRFEDEYLNRKVPIIVDSLHPETNFILFHKRDYIYFGYQVPDTMNWLFNCVEASGSYIFSPAPISPD